MVNFQGCVPYAVSKKHTKSPIKSVIATILFFVFLIGIFLCLVYFRKIEKCYEKQSFYVVYVEKNRRKIDVDNVELIKKLGGAGSVLFFKEEYYLIANVYLKENDAKEIAEGLVSTFAEAGVIKLEHESISKKKALHIAQNLSVSKFFEKFYVFLGNLEDMQMQYVVGSLAESEFLTKMLKVKLDFESIVDEMENPDNEKIFDDIKTHAHMFLNYFQAFFDEFLKQSKKESMICALKFNFVKLKVDLFDNLR